MTDLDVAILVIKAATASGFTDEDVLETAMELRPELPWKIAAEGLYEAHGDPYYMARWCTSGDPLPSEVAA
jgi:hypothetical protein